MAVTQILPGQVQELLLHAASNSAKLKKADLATYEHSLSLKVTQCKCT